MDLHIEICTKLDLPTDVEEKFKKTTTINEISVKIMKIWPISMFFFKKHFQNFDKNFIDFANLQILIFCWRKISPGNCFGVYIRFWLNFVSKFNFFLDQNLDFVFNRNFKFNELGAQEVGNAAAAERQYTEGTHFIAQF